LPDVLLVEDDDLVRYALRRVLEANHRSCAAFASVDAAKWLLAVHEPCVVLTDYNLKGGWTGIDLLTWMRRSPRLHEIPAVVMTGSDPEQIRGRLAAEGLGDVGVIVKPFEPGEAIRVLNLLGDHAVLPTPLGAGKAAALSGAPSGQAAGTESAGRSGA
jgi:CheY-like chemotaxis protein